MITLDTLSHELHSIAVRNSATGNEIAINGDGKLSAIVEATALDIRALSATTDTIRISQGGNDMIVNADGSINIQGDVSLAKTGFGVWKTSAETVTSTIGQLVSTSLTNRVSLLIQNLGAQDVFLGPDDAVTTGTGVRLSKGSSYAAELDSDAEIWAITASGSAGLRVVEYAAA